MGNKVAIIGTGNVGMSYAYALLNQQTQVNELVLIDVNKDAARGEALDLKDALAYSHSSMKISDGEYSDCADADLVCICAGARQAPGETRLDLTRKNATIFEDIVTQVVASNFDGIFLVVSNPLDVMTYLTWHYSRFPLHRVIGSGTTLDTARLRYNVGNILDVDPKDVQAHVIGEHGDSGFIPWSRARLSIQNLNDILTDEQKHDVSERVRNAAYTIIGKKGSTHYGIGGALARITRAIFSDENTTLPVSNYDPKSHIFYGSPAVIGREGVKRRLDFDLDENEQAQLDHSIKIISDAIDSVITDQPSHPDTSQSDQPPAEHHDDQPHH